MDNLKKKTLNGLFWSAIERFGYTFIMFISNLFLARLLSPDDFGVIAMIMVFVSFSSIIVDAGFGSALIQKKEIDDIDYSTVFFFNIILAAFLYSLLFLGSPYIAEFYNTEILNKVLPILGLVLIFNSLGIVQISKLKRELNFKLLGIVSIISSILGCFIGVFLAYKGYGIWSLVCQSIFISFFRSLLLFILVKWYPLFKFSLKSFRNLFNFGSMILLSNIVDTLYTNLIPLITGKMFTPKDLGDYTQARTLEAVPNQTLVTIVNQVTFPVLSKLQDDSMTFIKYVRKSIKLLSWVNFPIMVLLVIIARPLFILLYTDKWIDAVPIFQIACLGGMFQCIIQINNCILTAKGNSGYMFISRIVKQVIGLFLIIIGALIGGLYGMVILSLFIAPIIFVFISIYYTKKVEKYGYSSQIKDFIMPLVISLISAIVPYLLSIYSIYMNGIIEMISSITIYVFTYIALSIVFKLEIYSYIKIKKNK